MAECCLDKKSEREGPRHGFDKGAKVFFGYSSFFLF